MLYVNDVSDTVRTFLAERSGTPIPELVELCRAEGAVFFSNAVTMPPGKVYAEHAADLLVIAGEFLSVAQRLESGELF
jgi:hypothetical protein